MSSFGIKLASVALFFLVIFLSGNWISHTGKPYSVFIFTIHKLIGLAAGVYLVLAVYQAYQANSINPIVVIAILITFLFFAGLVATGGLLSTETPLPASVAGIHKVFPYLAVISTGATIYLLS